MVVYLVDLDWEAKIQNINNQPLTHDQHADLMRAILDEVGNLPPTSQNPVILTTSRVRKKLKRLIEKEFPRLVVLCYEELSPDLNIQPIARIGPF